MDKFLAIVVVYCYFPTLLYDVQYDLIVVLNVKRLEGSKNEGLASDCDVVTNDKIKMEDHIRKVSVIELKIYCAMMIL